MTLSMARCIGEAGCTGKPSARGLCGRCYTRHQARGSLNNYPTMQERTRVLRERGEIPHLVSPVRPRSDSSRTNAMMSYRYARYAERVDVDGTLIHPTSRHGYLHSYNCYGCRGNMCREALRHYRRTGETCIPAAAEQDFSPEDCFMYERPL